MSEGVLKIRVMTEHILKATRLLGSLVPQGLPLVVREPLIADEAAWLIRAVEEGVVAFRECDPSCPRLKKRGIAGPDEFVTPTGVLRHLFSSPASVNPSLNREYIPHIAAYARAILDFGYSKAHSSLSLYRTFTRDLINKRQGVSFETDAEFYDGEGNIHLHIEAKKDAKQVSMIARQLKESGTLSQLPASMVKEIEYVLDLRPKFFWLVGPGSIEPAAFVYSVRAEGLNASFDLMDAFPHPPKI